MRDERRDEVRDHEFDGIQEFDNRLPNWWVGTFVITVLFGIWYWTDRHTFAQPGEKTIQSEFQADMLALENLQDASGGGLPSDEKILAALKNAAALAAGRQVFNTNCLVCHARDGGGGIGPNLTDKYWIHGHLPSEIGRVITKGVPEKGMVTWKGVLSPDQIIQVAAFVVSLKGTKAAKPKAPQGQPE